jgi:TRAP-type C4-dicarboxylate transport system substrate-binding protein
MRKQDLLYALAMVMVVAGLVVPVGSANAASEEFTWKVQSVWARGDVSMEKLAYFAERVRERSNGRLKIEVFAEPEIVPLPEVFPACSKGAIEMAQGGGAVWSMMVPFGDVYFGSVPRLWNLPGVSVEEGAIKQRKFLFESGAVDILRREFAKHNLYWLDMHTAGSVCHLSKKEVHTLDDIKGLKLADLGGWMAQWHAALGWVPVEMLPASEMEMALRLGTIDCLDYDLSAITGFGWHKVAPYWVANEGLVTHILQDILVNMDSWNKLPDDLKEALAGAAEDYFHKCNEAYGALEARVRTMVDAGEVVEISMDEEYQRAADKAAYELWDKAAAEDPVSAELIQLIKKFRGIE